MSVDMSEEEKERLATDIKSRVLWVIDSVAYKGSRYAFLEERTGIAARKWKNMCNGVTSPSVEMLEQLALMRPCLAAWLLTGDAVGDQVSPCQGGDVGNAVLERSLGRGPRSAAPTVLIDGVEFVPRKAPRKAAS